MSRPVDTYTHGHQRAVVANHARRTVEDSAAFVTDELRSGVEVLDVGCGPGTITVGIARRVAPATVIAIDSAASVLEQAREHSRAEGVTNIVFAEGNAYELDFEDERFDLVYAHQVLQHLTEPVAALREAHRVLRPGGLVAVRDADYATMTHAPRFPMIDRWLELYHQVTTHNRVEADAGRHLLAWVRAAGFDDPRATTSTWTYATPERRREWGYTWAERVTASSFAEQAVDYGYATAAELDAIATAWREWAEHPDGWFAFIHGEVVAVKASS